MTFIHKWVSKSAKSLGSSVSRPQEQQGERTRESSQEEPIGPDAEGEHSEVSSQNQDQEVELGAGDTRVHASGEAGEVPRRVAGGKSPEQLTESNIS